MKKALILILSIFFGQILFSQTIDLKSIEAKVIDKIVESNGYPGSQHPIMIEKEKKIIEFLEQNPEAKMKSLGKPMAWGFNVGDTHSWWADYFPGYSNPPSDQYEVLSTCRAVGTNCYIFVEDAVWNVNVDQTAVDAIATEFDNTIYATDVATFGTPPDVDSDPKIIILILDIKDGNDPSSYVAGYFYSLNEIADTPGSDGNRSNEAEIFYMDCNPADLLTAGGRFNVFGTTAHEFQHMIHYAHGHPEMTFLNEGLSEIASYICGYGLRSNGLYAQNTNRNLLTWDDDDALPDYARAAQWMLYVYEQFGAGILKDFVDNQHGDWAAIETRLQNYDSSRGFWTFFREWLIANYANGYSSDTKYGYQYSPIAQSSPVTTYLANPNGSESRQVTAMGAEYIKFEGGTDLTINFTGDATIQVYALKLGSLEVEKVDLGSNYTVANYDSFDEVTFLVYNLTAGSPANYSYSATGGSVAQMFEIAYEDGVPEGFFEWNTGDSCAVIFSGIPGAKLDSVKVAFRNSGNIVMDISLFNNSSQLRGGNLYGPVLLNSPNGTASSNPYPVPYDNWVTVDFSSQSRPISVGNDFVVSFLIGNDPTAPGIMVSSEPDDGENHSRTYTENGGTTQWWIFHNGGTPLLYWNYLVRAYASIGDATVAIDPSGIVSIPNDFSLGANYPNPFNPSTTFDFATPNDGVVNFTVYDLLGQIIYSENRNILAGNYQFTWDGQNQLDQQVVSGVYFLKMEAEGFTQTRKMLMMK